jgi:hypothetical protein
MLSKTPAGWFNFHLQDENRFYLYQRGVNGNPEPTFLNVNPKNEKLSRTIVVDGVLMLVKKSVWEEVRFDEDNFKEFHFYDIDFSLRVAEKYNNYITYELLIEHMSFGDINKSWVNNVLIFERLWKEKLPLYLYSVRSADLNKEEKRKLIFLISNLIKYQYSFGSKLKVIKKFLKLNPLLFIKYMLKSLLK